MRLSTERGRPWSCLSVCLLTALAACGAPKTAPSTLKGSPRAMPKLLASPANRLNLMPGGDLGDTWLDLNGNVALGHPGGRLDEILISRSQYVISWNPLHRQPNWVAWRLAWTDLGLVPRAKNFTIDHELDDLLKTVGQRAVKPTDYRGSCMDRGHQIPSGDRTAWEWDNKATFMMDNIIPQSAHLNRVTWEHLEHHTRELVTGTEEAVYVLAGPIFPAVPHYIGPDWDIAVPSHNFKIIVRGAAFAPGHQLASSDILASVIMPNTTSTGTDPIIDRDQACADAHIADEFAESTGPAALLSDWQQYSTPVSAIRAASGLDLSYLE